MPTIDAFLDAAPAVASADDFLDGKPTHVQTTAQDEQAGAQQIGNIDEPEGHIPSKYPVSPDGLLHESHPYSWARIRQTPLLRKILGPTPAEHAAIEAGALAGPPGSDPGIVPVVLNSPLPFSPGPEMKLAQNAQKLLLGYFIARNAADQPERIAEIQNKFQSGDTKGAWHDILGDTLQTGMAALGAKSLFEKTPTMAVGEPQPENAGGGVDVNDLVKNAIRKAKQEGVTPEFRSLFGGIDPAVAGTTPEKVQALAKSLGMDWVPEAKPEAPAPEPAKVPEVAPVKTADEFLDTEAAPPPVPKESGGGHGLRQNAWRAIYQKLPPEAREIMEGILAKMQRGEPLTKEEAAALAHVNNLVKEGVEIQKQHSEAPGGTVPVAAPQNPEQLPPVAGALTHASNVEQFTDTWQGLQDSARVIERATQPDIDELTKQLKGKRGVEKKAIQDQIAAAQNKIDLAHAEAEEKTQQLANTYTPLIAERAKAVGITDPNTLENIKGDFFATVTDTPGVEWSHNKPFGEVLNAVLAEYKANPDRDPLQGPVTPPESTGLVDLRKQPPGTAAVPVAAPAKPAEAPAQAAAKVEKQVKTVAREAGQRPAKEVKSELVARLEKAIEAAPAAADYNFKKHGEATIQIPGDGTFTVVNAKETLSDVLKRARGLDTSSEKRPAALPRSPAATLSPSIANAALKIYGTAERAAAALETQAANAALMKDLGYDTAKIQEVKDAAEILRERTPKRILESKVAEIEEMISNMRADLARLPEAIARHEERLQSLQKKPQSKWTKAERKVSGYLKYAKDDLALSQQDLPIWEARLATVQAELAALNNPPAPKVAGFGGSTRRTQKVAVPLGAPGQAPAVNPLRQYFGNQAAGVQSVVAPQTLAPDARNVGNALRHFMGMNALAMVRAEEALGSWRSEFDKSPVPADYIYDPAQPLPHNYAVIDGLERDRTSLPARYRALGDVFDKEFEWRIAEIQKYAPNALRHLIANYFPHVWQDPKRAADVMAQVASRLFAGRKEFLKQRSLAFFAEGLATGLKPISDNPVDLLMAKMHSMDKFLLALRATAEFRASGAMKFKYLFERLPDGWTTIDDPSFIVQRPPTVTVTEAHDEFQRAKLGEILQDLGVSYKRVVSLGGRRWAEADLGMKEIRAKIGADEPILWHELGHQLDWHFPQLQNALDMRGNSPVAQQLRALVDLNHPNEKHDPKKSYHRYLRKSEEKMAEIFRAYVHAPDLFQKTAPDVWKIVKDFLDTQPSLRDKLNEMSRGRLAIGSESTQIKLGGMQLLGDWMMPIGPAQVIKNFLSPGLARYGAYRTFRGASNILNSAQLGLSGFHLGFTSLDAATSRLAIAIEDAAHGDFGRAAKTLASVPVSPVTNILQGRKMIKEARTPGSTNAEVAALVKALEQAGGRVGQDAFWKTHFTRRMIRALHETRNNAALIEMPDVKVLLNAPFTLIEQSMRPIMEYIVPRQKLGVFADMARREMERLGPNATVDQTREAMRKAWDSVDNRMGQLVYDNLFYNRALKDIALLTFRAYGWQLGKYREGVGALIDTGKAVKQLGTGKAPEVTHRMAYAMALPMLLGILGAIATMIMTRRRPHGMDYFMPPTGEIDAKGNPARLNFPSYMKDVLAYSKHPITSVGHSLNPMFSGMADLLENKDFYGVEIRHPDDPLWKQGGQVAQFAAKQFVPFSVSGAQKMHENGSPVWKEVAPFFGLTPVPSRMTMTPAQELAGDLMAQGMGDEPRTQEQFDKSKMIKDMARAIKAAPLDRKPILKEARDSGKLDPLAMQALMDRMKYNPLQFQVFHLGAADGMKVWRVADTNEQAQLRTLMEAKVINSKVLPMETKQAYLGELTRPVR